MTDNAPHPVEFSEKVSTKLARVVLTYRKPRTAPDSTLVIATPQALRFFEPTVHFCREIFASGAGLDRAWLTLKKLPEKLDKASLITAHMTLQNDDPYAASMAKPYWSLFLDLTVAFDPALLPNAKGPFVLSRTMTPEKHPFDGQNGIVALAMVATTSATIRSIAPYYPNLFQHGYAISYLRDPDKRVFLQTADQAAHLRERVMRMSIGLSGPVNDPSKLH